MPLNTQSNELTNGVDGDVYLAFPGNVKYQIAGLSKWSLKDNVAITKFKVWSNPVRATTGVPYAKKLKADGDASYSIEGVVNLDAVQGTFVVNAGAGTGCGILAGLPVTADLVASKSMFGQPVGYPGVVGILANVQPGQNYGDNVFGFTADLEVNGVPPEFGTITVA